MSSPRLACFLLLLLSLALGIAPARAASVCVSDATGLLQALNNLDLQPDGTTFTIKLVQNTYAVGNGFGDVLRETYPRTVGLQLLGGYTAGCGSRQVNPGNTVIDGLGLPGGGLIVQLHGEANLLVEGLTFTRLAGASFYGTVLEIGSDSAGNATYAVRYCRFLHNSGAELIRIDAPQMQFVNNLVAQNTLSGGVAAALYAQYPRASDAMLLATNNTIANNSGGDGIRIATLGWTSERSSMLIDNILWGNGRKDLALADFDTAQNPLLVTFNVVGSASGPALSPDNLRSDPKFTNPVADNFRLASNSPAINSGAAIQPWGFPAHDLGGGARIVGSAIDRGAYESAIDDAVMAVVTTPVDNGNNAAPVPGSLRAAIKAANAAAGPFRITFNITGGCPSLLSLASPMLDITGDVTIDASTQPGWIANSQYGKFDAKLCLYVNGAGNPNTPWALHVPPNAPVSARLVVRGMGFAGFSDAAIKLEGGRNHRIWGSQFGAVPFTSGNKDAIRVTGNSGGAFIGGYDDPGAVNMIAGSTAAGIHLDNAAGGSTIANALIGYQADGSGDGGNAVGVFAFNSPKNVVQYSYIGHSTSTAITLSSAGAHDNTVQYNTLGIGAGGDAAPNATAGVLVNFGAHDNTIGSPLSAGWGGNAIVRSGGPGVWISTSGGSGNRVLGNTFQANAGIDIDLAQAGASANQPSNPASGPNNLQNYPVLASARRDAATKTETVSGTLTSTPNTTYRLDIYYAIACSSAPGGRGAALLPMARTSITTGALGSVPFTATVAADLGALPLGAISAIVTDPAGNTSEIGNCVSEEGGDLIFRNGFE